VIEPMTDREKMRPITHPLSPFLVRIWGRLFCRREWHLFDEVGGEDHYLSCDACGLMVGIDYVSEEYRDDGRG
jgi:hypothetical protein